MVQSLPRERLHELQGGRARHTALDHVALAWVLAALGQYHRIPFDEQLVLGQLARPFDFESVVSAAESIGLRAAWKSRRASSLGRLPVPFVAVLDRSRFEPRQGSGAARDLASLAPEAPEPRLAFVLKVEDGRVAFFEQGRQGHVILPLTDFAARYQGLVLLAKPEPKALSDPDAAGARREPFGFRWFVPELLKHRKAFQDVLLASLAINVMALATPLFSQVVIDKVVVHHTFNTLMVVGAGLLAFRMTVIVLCVQHRA